MIESIAVERVNRGLTQSDLAEAIAVSPKTIANIEAGHRPSPRVGKKLADYLGCKYTDLWPIDPRGVITHD